MDTVFYLLDDDMTEPLIEIFKLYLKHNIVILYFNRLQLTASLQNTTLE